MGLYETSMNLPNILLIFIFLMVIVDVKHALKGDVFKVSPENTGVSFDDVKGVRKT